VTAGIRYLVDTLTLDRVYSPKPGAITNKDLDVQASNYITFEPQSIYTIQFTPAHKIPRNGKIFLNFPPTEFGMSTQPSQLGDYRAKVGSRLDKQLAKVNLNRGVGEVELLDAFTEDSFDPRIETEKTIKLQIGNIRNPRSLKPTSSIVIRTTDSSGNLIDTLQSPLSITMTQLG
jgi:hypothetical protein